MKRGHPLGGAKAAFVRQATRLSREYPLRVSLLFVPFLLVTVLSLYIGLETAPRLYGIGKPLEKLAAASPDHEVWLSIAVRKDMLMITTRDGHIFSWPVEGPKHADVAKLQSYLRQKAENIVRNSVRGGQADQERGIAALSVDQGLTYHHVRPVIFALAGAGFSKYGFETRVVH